jgi:hypothetical protein
MAGRCEPLVLDCAEHGMLRAKQDGVTITRFAEPRSRRHWVQRADGRPQESVIPAAR